MVMMIGLFLIGIQPIPVGNPAAWSASAEYPPIALRNGEQGRVGYQLDVDASGQVTGCRITTSSGSASLDAATCPHLLRVASFHPEEVPSAQVRHFNGAVNYRQTPERVMTMLVNNLPPALQNAHTGIVFTVTREGRVTNCHVEESSGSDKLDALACSKFEEKARFGPTFQPIESGRFKVKWAQSKSR